MKFKQKLYKLSQETSVFGKTNSAIFLYHGEYIDSFNFETTALLWRGL